MGALFGRSGALWALGGSDFETWVPENDLFKKCVWAPFLGSKNMKG